MLFFRIMFTEFIAEMGDKTQLMLVAMTSRYKLKDIILGTAAAILVLSGISVLAGGLISEFVPTWLIRLAAACAFLYFALTSLKPEDDEEETANDKGSAKFAPLAVFLTFFVAELGDKTQLMAITFGANEGLNAALIVWLACSTGFFAADILGMLAGYVLQSKMPEGFLQKLAFVIFTVYGILTLRQALSLLFPAGNTAIIGTVIVTVIFAALCLAIWKSQKTKSML